MERLKELIRGRMIKAIFMYHPDRGPSKPAHRLLLRAMCEEYGVSIVTCQGQIPEGEMGEVMEFLDAWSKEKQVLRAQQGAKDGLRDRVRIRGLPASSKAPYGYRWDGARFVPADTYSVAQGIWKMLLEGKRDRYIAGALTRSGIPTPSGRRVWAPRTISGMATNPAYCGRYTGLRTRKVVPKRRYKETYGKTGTAHRPVDEHVVLDGLILEPIITPEDFFGVQERRTANKASGGKSVVRYLLRGMVVCGLCGRHATGTSNGQPNKPYAYYRCTRYSGPIGAHRCSDPPVSASWIEGAVWNLIREFLESPEVFPAQMGTEEATRVQTVGTIRVIIARLERQVREYEGYRQRAFDLLVKGSTDEDTYRRSVAGYGAHLAWLEEELSRQRADVERAEARQWSVEVIKALYPKLQAALETATWEDRRFVLECLQTRVVLEGREATVELAVPEYIVDAVGTTPRETPPQALRI